MRVLSFTSRNFKEVYRDPVTSMLGIILPVIFLVIFSSIEKKMPLEMFSAQYITPGIIIFSFAFIIMFAAVLIAKDKQTSFLTRLFTTPLKPVDYIASYIIPFIPLAFMQILVCFFVGTLFGAVFTNILLTLVVFLLTALSCICLGLILGSLFSLNQVSGIGSLLITLIGLFSGIWMDLNMVGGVFKVVGYALPFAHAVDTAKSLLIKSDFSSVSDNFLVVVIYSVVLFILAVLSFRKAMKIK